MQAFVDETEIEVSSGKGGAGGISFRREKYVPNGGPDGGDGGKGGDVIFRVKDNLRTLFELKRLRFFRAQGGQQGMGKKRHGKDGRSVYIDVPPGTIIRDKETGDILKDFEKDEREWVFLEGGRGGKGNWHFRTARKQTPRYAQPGMPGEVRKLRVELQIVADIGFVGYPNAGKSTLLSVLTNAHPKIGAYAFTTKTPNIGVLQSDEKDVVLADIPGIIEGASHGAGLGIRFLKHINRTAGLAFLVDMSTGNHEEIFKMLLSELETFSPLLLEKRRVILATKMDAEEAEEHFEEFKQLFPDEEIISASSYARTGLDDIKRYFFKMAELHEAGK